MALRFVDSFDHYATANIDQKWTLSPTSVLTTAGRHGSGMAFTNSAGAILKTLDFQNFWTVGFAVKGPGVSNNSANIYTLQALTAGGQLQDVAWVRINEDLSLSVVVSGGAIIGTTPAYDWAGFHYVELQTTLTGTATVTAACTLRVNTETVVTGSHGTDFAASALAPNAAKANVHKFASQFGTIDDLYIADGGGTTNTSFIGDVTIGVVYPNGDVTTNWTGTGSSTATHYLNINGTNPDDDTSYEYSTNTGSMDLFEWQDIASFSGTVKGVQYSLYARKDDEGARAINMVEGTAGTNTLTNAITGKVDIYLNDNYDYHHLCLDTSPTTGTGWTVTDFNSSRFGFVVATNT